MALVGTHVPHSGIVPREHTSIFPSGFLIVTGALQVSVVIVVAAAAVVAVVGIVARCTSGTNECLPIGVW
jgi:hypothetical protein